MAFVTLCQAEQNTQKGQVSFVHFVCLQSCFKMWCATYGRQRFRHCQHPGRLREHGTKHSRKILALKRTLFFLQYTIIKHANKSHGLTSMLFSFCLLLFTVRGLRGPWYLRRVKGCNSSSNPQVMSASSNSTTEFVSNTFTLTSSPATAQVCTKPNSNRRQSLCKCLSVCVGADDLFLQLMSPEWVERNFISIDWFAREVNRPS